MRDVLDLDLVAPWVPEVVAGSAHLHRAVRWLHVAEALDVGVMLSGGEMVLTTGLLLAGDERAQREYVESMQRADVAAVVLGLGRAFRTTPEPMRRAAERCGVPLIVLHRPAPFARLTEEVHARLVHGRFAALDLSDRVRSSLTALNLSGASLQQVLDEIAAHSGCPAVVVNLAQRVLASAGDKGSLNDLLRDWERVSGQVAELAGSGAVTVGPDGWIVAPLEARGRQWGRLVLFGHRGPEEFGRVLGARASEALAALKKAAAGTENMMEATVECARAGVTTGEWSWALRDVFGEFRAPTGVSSAPVAVTAEAGTPLAVVREKVARTAEELGSGRLRLLVGKPGLDGHSNGAEQIAVRARDAGFEVVYQGIRLTPEQIVSAALAEDVHCVGLSILSGSHSELVPDVLDRLREAGAADIPVIVGGIIPNADAADLKRAGVAAVFTPKDFGITEIIGRIVDEIRQANKLSPLESTEVLA